MCEVNNRYQRILSAVVAQSRQLFRATQIIFTPCQLVLDHLKICRLFCVSESVDMELRAWTCVTWGSYYKAAFFFPVLFSLLIRIYHLENLCLESSLHQNRFCSRLEINSHETVTTYWPISFTENSVTIPGR